MMDDFETAEIQTGEASIFVRWSGSGLADPLVARFSTDTPDVAQRRADACP